MLPNPQAFCLDLAMPIVDGNLNDLCPLAKMRTVLQLITYVAMFQRVVL